MNTPNKRDSDKAKKIALIFVLFSVLLGIAFWLFLPLASSFIDQYFSPGLGVKDAAVAAFFVTVITLVIFAVAAGDGLLGELQFILSGFVGFFIVLWLLIAWIF